ncbi:hypothetical protein GCM10023319_64080 [Nocardia iowensis]
MQGNWNHDKAHHRCRFPAEYAIANNIDHPAVVYLRGDQIIGPVDSWLAQVFRRDQIEQSLAMLEQAQPDSSATVTSMRAIQQSLNEYDRKLNSYRAALEAGTDPPDRDLDTTGPSRMRSRRPADRHGGHNRSPAHTEPQ